MPWPSRSAESFCAALMAFLMLAPAASAADTTHSEAAPEVLLLDWTVNGRPGPGVLRLETTSTGRTLVEASSWRQAGLRADLPTTRLSNGEDALDITDLPGLELTLDRAAMSLRLQGPAQLFVGSALDATQRKRWAPAPEKVAWMLDYDLLHQRSGQGGGSTAVWTQAVVSGPWGHVVHASVLSDSASGRTTTRQDTYWRLDRPEHRDAVVLGDTLTDGGGWSRTARYAGLRWARDFTLQPGTVWSPTLALTGEAVLPSTVDVLVDNVRRLSVPVEPGPFSIRNVPMVNGAGQVNLVVRDALGRETVVTQSVYGSPRLLQPGTTDFSLEAGALRQGWGATTSYGDGFVAGSWRQGLTLGPTAQARGEWQPRRQAAGLDLAGLLGTWASARAGLAASHGNVQGTSGAGWQTLVGLERTSREFGATLQHQRASRGFAPFAETADASALGWRLRSQSLLALSARLPDSIGVGVSLARQARWSGDRQASLTLSASTYVAGRASVSLNLTRQRPGGGWLAMLALTLPLGERMYSSSSVQARPDGHSTADTTLSKSPDSLLGVGWSLGASTEESRRARAAVYSRTQRLDSSVDLASDAQGQVAARLNLRGTLGLVAGIPFASRSVGTGGVALVEVGDLAGVVVRHSHQAAATTDASGRAVIAGLFPWSRNTIELDAGELPLDVELGETSAEVYPYARSAVVVRFQARRTRQALLSLRQADGSPVPDGAELRLAPQDTRTLVGQRGEAWLVDLQQRDQRITVRWPGGGCELVLPPLDPAQAVHLLGPLTCAGASP